MRKPNPLTLLRACDAADLLGVSTATVYRLMRNGRIRTVVIGRERRIARGALEQFVAA